MAGRASLSFLGQEDISLSGDPQVTYFVERYAGQTQFSQRVDQVIFDGQSVSFGSENHRILPKNGDLITNMYMLVQFPSIVPNVSVLDSVGTLMFQYVELYIGSELVERLYGEYIEMTYDLTVPKGKQPGLAFLTGKTLQYQNVPLSSYYVPLPFSLFNKGSSPVRHQGRCYVPYRLEPFDVFHGAADAIHGNVHGDPEYRVHVHFRGGNQVYAGNRVRRTRFDSRPRPQNFRTNSKERVFHSPGRFQRPVFPRFLQSRHGNVLRASTRLGERVRL